MTNYVQEVEQSIIDVDKRTLLRVFVSGIILGFIVWGLTYLFQRYIMQSIVCESNVDTCQSSVVYSGNIVAVIMTIVGVSVLVKIGVFRPLLIVIATLISLWGLASWLSEASLLMSAVWTSLLYAVCYVSYSWLARIRNAWAMILVVAVVIVVGRIIPMITS